MTMQNNADVIWQKEPTFPNPVRRVRLCNEKEKPIRRNIRLERGIRHARIGFEGKQTKRPNAKKRSVERERVESELTH